MCKALGCAPGHRDEEDARTELSVGWAEVQVTGPEVPGWFQQASVAADLHSSKR